jgi:hypothetical protein
VHESRLGGVAYDERGAGVSAPCDEWIALATAELHRRLAARGLESVVYGRQPAEEVDLIPLPEA